MTIVIVIMIVTVMQLIMTSIRMLMIGQTEVNSIGMLLVLSSYHHPNYIISADDMVFWLDDGQEKSLVSLISLPEIISSDGRSWQAFQHTCKLLPEISV